MASAINLKLFLLDKYSTWTLCCNTLIAHSSVYMYMLLEAHGFLINWHVISISDCIYPIAYNLWLNFTFLTRLILSLILHPGQGLPDVLQTEGGQEGGHQGVLKSSSSTVAPAWLTHNLCAQSDHLKCEWSSPWWSLSATTAGCLAWRALALVEIG